MFVNILKNFSIQVRQSGVLNKKEVFNKQVYRFGIFDVFSKKKFQQTEDERTTQYEENLKKAEKSRKRREGDTIIVEDEKLEAELRKREAEADELFDPNKFTTKENYIKLLRRDREKDEEERELSKETIQEIEKRKQREQEVEQANIDYAKIAAQNINIRPVETFKHPEELFYFVSDLQVRLTEDNLKACLDGFFSLADRINEADIESSNFQKFVQILISNIKLMGDNELLLLTAKFGDLYCITEPKFWETLEIQIAKKLEQINSNSLVEILEHFSHQKEGTEFFFDKIESVFEARINNLTINQLARISKAYLDVERGTKEFFSLVQREIEQKINDGSVQDLLLISHVYKNSKSKDKLFRLIEDGLMNHVKEFDFYTACKAASGFGFLLGSSKFYNQLEVKVQLYLSNHIDTMSIEDFKLILDGFLHTYRGSLSLFQILRQRFLTYLPEFSTIEAARIVKSLYLVEFDDKEIYRKYEERIIYELQGVNEITLEEILEISKSYTLTRNGSRKIYKLLEIVITHRWSDICKDNKVMKELYVYYSKSGLCSETLMELMERFNLINN